MIDLQELRRLAETAQTTGVMKSLCDKWCVYKFDNSGETLCTANGKYDKPGQPIVDCDKYKKFLAKEAQ